MRSRNLLLFLYFEHLARRFRVVSDLGLQLSSAQLMYCIRPSLVTFSLFLVFSFSCQGIVYRLRGLRFSCISSILGNGNLSLESGREPGRFSAHCRIQGLKNTKKRKRKIIMLFSVYAEGVCLCLASDVFFLNCQGFRVNEGVDEAAFCRAMRMILAYSGINTSNWPPSAHPHPHPHQD